MIEWIVGTVLAKHGRIDALINNSGIVACYEPVHGTDLASWNKVIAVDLTGTFLGMQVVLPSMRQARKRSIIDFSSIWGMARSVSELCRARCHTGNDPLVSSSG